MRPISRSRALSPSHVPCHSHAQLRIAAVETEIPFLAAPCLIFSAKRKQYRTHPAAILTVSGRNIRRSYGKVVSCRAISCRPFQRVTWETATRRSASHPGAHGGTGTRAISRTSIDRSLYRPTIAGQPSQPATTAATSRRRRSESNLRTTADSSASRMKSEKDSQESRRGASCHDPTGYF